MSYRHQHSDLAEFAHDELTRYREAGLLGRLSELSGIDYESVQAWARGLRNPSTASIEKVLDAMGYKIVVKKKDPTRAWW